MEVSKATQQAIIQKFVNKNNWSKQRLIAEWNDCKLPFYVKSLRRNKDGTLDLDDIVFSASSIIEASAAPDPDPGPGPAPSSMETVCVARNENGDRNRLSESTKAIAVSATMTTSMQLENSSTSLELYPIRPSCICCRNSYS